MLLTTIQHDTIFYSQYFWFYVFGTLILLYIAAVVYQRIKRPKKGISAVKVRVEAINQVRVQTNPRTAFGDKMYSSAAHVPGARFDVTFTDEEKNEALVFSVGESVCEQIKTGETGVLRYNGSEFISFNTEKAGVC